jgi:5-hydroxyisourate hydrolase
MAQGECPAMTLSTHVLDTAHGKPAAGLALRLYRGDSLLLEGVTNQDGRCPAIADLSLSSGSYRLEFEVASYFRSLHVQLPEPPFLDCVRVDFGMADSGHYHVPLLVSPFAYSTYRGS